MRSHTSIPSYYIDRKPRLLKEYDFFAHYVRPVLARNFSPELMDTIVAETRQEYERLIPQLPFIGGKRPFTRFVIYTGLWLAIYRTASAHGKTVDEAGVLVFEIGREFLKAYPAFLGRFLKGVNYSRPYLYRLRRRALLSQQHRYAEDYVYYFVPGDGLNFDYGVDYTECASCKFLARQGAPELAKYLCPVDILYSESLGWGLTRTMTLAEGYPKCDFRFKKDGPTRVSVPAPLQAYLKSESS